VLGVVERFTRLVEIGGYELRRVTLLRVVVRGARVDELSGRHVSSAGGNEDSEE